MNELYLGAYWGPRQESIDECANRLMACLERLHECNDAFANWFEKGKSRKSALHNPLDFQSREKVLSILAAGRHRRNLDRSVIDDLGFHIGLWNGYSDFRSVAISVSCGLYCESPHLRNSVVLDLPEELGSVSGKDQCIKILNVVADTWEPDWAGVISETSRNVRQINPELPFVDWMFYINRIGIDHTKLPATATAREIEGKGTVIIVQDRPIDPACQHDLANANAIEMMLSITDCGRTQGTLK